MIAARHNQLGQDAWSIGPGFVVLAMPGKWVIGALAYNVWSFIEDDSDRDEVNKLVAQYFVNYNFGSGWYVTSTPTLSADWEADSDERWTVPIGGGLGRLVRFGKQPVDFKGQVFYNLDGPSPSATGRSSSRFLRLAASRSTASSLRSRRNPLMWGSWVRWVSLTYCIRQPAAMMG